MARNINKRLDHYGCGESGLNPVKEPFARGLPSRILIQTPPAGPPETGEARSKKPGGYAYGYRSVGWFRPCDYDGRNLVVF